VDKNKSNPWEQHDSFAAHQLAWTQAPGTSDARDRPGWAPPFGPEREETSNLRREDTSPLLWKELNAIVGSGTAFHGTLSFSGQVRIDGEFAGQILGGHLLVIGEGARVQGEIRAQHVIVLGGNVKADIFAADRIELYVPAQVAGDLRAPEIHMDRGVKFQGTCDLSEPSAR